MNAMQDKPGFGVTRYPAFGGPMTTRPPFFTRARGITLPVFAIAAVFAVAAYDRDRNRDGGEWYPASAAQTTSPNVPTASRAAQDTMPADWKAVDQAIGRAGKAQPGGVYKYSFPRSDLKVRVGDVTIKPALALGGWVAFKGAGRSAMTMG